MENIVVKSRIKEVAGNCNVGGDFAETLNKMLVEEIKKASKRSEANGRKTVQGRDTCGCGCEAKKCSSTMLVSKSKSKEVISGKMNVGGDFASALNCVAHWLVKDACMRAEANGRKTIQSRDL